MKNVVEAILISMSSVTKPQLLFMMNLFSVLVVFQGKATFRNLSLIDHELDKGAERIAAIDASFMRKSGHHTEGLGWFYHGQLGRTMIGLELSLICAIDAKQTIDNECETRIDFYARQVTELATNLKDQNITYLVADVYYSKVKFIDAICSSHLDMIGKLRIDADLQWYFEGEYKGIERPKTYDGKMNFQSDLNRFKKVGQWNNEIDVYTVDVHAKAFKRKIHVVLLRWIKNDKEGTALLFSTDTTLDAMKIIQYYKARFQIEFLFRDAKQYTGLMDFQARCKEAIHTQINASLTALSLLKFEDRRQKQVSDETVISIASWRRKNLTRI